MDKQTGRPEKSTRYVLEPRDNRAEPRMKTTPLAVRVLGECRRTYGYARDISPSGMQIRTFTLCDSWPKPVGDSIRIEFFLPETGIKFACNAKVMWDRVPQGGAAAMSLQGVWFEDIDTELREKIGELARSAN